jgi:large subunit ribosomal protein L4
VSADEIKNTPDVEAAAEPEKTEAVAAETTEAAAADAAPEAAKKPAAKKPAAKKTAAAKAEGDEAKAEKKAPAKKPAARKAKPADEKAAKPAAKKPAAKKAAPAKAEKAAPKKAAKKPAAKAAPAEPKAERPPKQKAPAKAAAEERKGAAGTATFVDASGKELEARKLADARFAVPADVNTLHLVVRAEQAARRRGTASSKTRGEVSGSTAKLYRQKGTGRARAGSVKSPIRTGGGVTFGPRPRSFAIKVNRKVVRQALAMALSNRAENGNVFVASGLKIDAPSTATMDEFLVNLDIAAPVLVVTHDEPTVTKSVRNLRYAEASEVGALSTELVLRARSLVLTEKAFAALNEA